MNFTYFVLSTGCDLPPHGSGDKADASFEAIWKLNDFQQIAEYKRGHNPRRFLPPELGKTDLMHIQRNMLNKALPASW